MKLLDMIQEIDEEGEDLTEWEIDFIGGFIDDGVTSFTDKQAEIVERIYNERIPK